MMIKIWVISANWNVTEPSLNDAMQDLSTIWTEHILYICTMKGSLFLHLILIQYLLSAASALSAASGHVWSQSRRNNQYCDHLNHWDSCAAVNISLLLDISTHCTLSHQILINSLCLTSNYPHTIWYCNYFVAIKVLSRLKIIRLKKECFRGSKEVWNINVLF